VPVSVAVIDAHIYIMGVMNNWDPTGIVMDRNGAIFTWTGNLEGTGDGNSKGERDFRFSPANTGEDSGWKKTWIVPEGRTGDDKYAWTSGDGTVVFNTDRLDNTNTDYNLVYFFR
jgi:hypothetical protein